MLGAMLGAHGVVEVIAQTAEVVLSQLIVPLPRGRRTPGTSVIITKNEGKKKRQCAQKRRRIEK
jgi:hypothetical protein